MLENRISETALYVPTLRLLSKEVDGFLTTSEIITRLGEELNIQGEDAKLLNGRNDTKFSQKVRNIISHRKVTHNIICRGLADYDKENKGLRITPSGRLSMQDNSVV